MRDRQPSSRSQKLKTLHHFSKSLQLNFGELKKRLFIVRNPSGNQSVKMYSNKPAVIITESILFTLLFFSQSPLGSQATCNCDLSLHNGNISLTERLSPPHFRMANFIPLVNIQPAIDYHNLTELYVKVVERYQSVTAIKDLMVSD